MVLAAPCTDMAPLGLSVSQVRHPFEATWGSGHGQQAGTAGRHRRGRCTLRDICAGGSETGRSRKTSATTTPQPAGHSPAYGCHVDTTPVPSGGDRRHAFFGLRLFAGPRRRSGWGMYVQAVPPNEAPYGNPTPSIFAVPLSLPAIASRHRRAPAPCFLPWARGRGHDLHPDCCRWGFR